MIRAAVIAVCALAGATACKSSPRVDSCDDPLSGVWKAADGSKYNAVQERGRVDVYPMFNAAHITDGVDYAPHMFGFARQGGALIGKRSQRATRKGNTCTIRTQAKITCADNRLTLSYRPMPAIDWARCKATTAKPVRTLTLSR